MGDRAHSGIAQGRLAELREIVGARHVLTGLQRTSAYAQGYRMGGGPVAAVVRPGSLIEMWRVFKVCISARLIVIAQAANTGLTGGSTPDGDYDRPVVVISTLRLNGIIPVRSGQEVVCLAGATLYDLEELLAPLGREPHSVIGSSCIGASVVGGVCNNSGGALIQRGPAYTELALYARVDETGAVALVNGLGIELGADPEAILRNLDQRRFGEPDVVSGGRTSSAADYEREVRGVEEATPARFNADPRRLHGASGSAGKVLVFAVRLETFPAPSSSAVFYIGTNEPDELGALRRQLLKNNEPLPISAEYIHREAFDIAARYGKDTVLAIRALGTARLPLLFRLKGQLDRLAGKVRVLPRQFSDRLLQMLSRLFPQHLPARMRGFRDTFEHHLILKVGDDAVNATRALLEAAFPTANGNFFECDSVEAEHAMLHRFAVAGAAVRYRAVHPDRVEDIVAIDIALRRDERDWFERLPAEIESQLLGKLYYGHFFCHVFHQDYLVRRGADTAELERRILALAEARGAEFPAEHNVGHHYLAKPALAEHYRSLDPTNAMNPGIGRTSRMPDWADQPPSPPVR